MDAVNNQCNHCDLAFCWQCLWQDWLEYLIYLRIKSGLWLQYWYASITVFLDIMYCAITGCWNNLVLLLVFSAEFATYLTVCRSLRFDDKPNYAYLRQLFQSLFICSGFTNDFVYDWNTVCVQPLYILQICCTYIICMYITQHSHYLQ